MAISEVIFEENYLGGGVAVTVYCPLCSRKPISLSGEERSDEELSSRYINSAKQTRILREWGVREYKCLVI